MDAAQEKELAGRLDDPALKSFALVDEAPSDAEKRSRVEAGLGQLDLCGPLSLQRAAQALLEAGKGQLVAGALSQYLAAFNSLLLRRKERHLEAAKQATAQGAKVIPDPRPPMWGEALQCERLGQVIAWLGEPLERTQRLPFTAERLLRALVSLWTHLYDEASERDFRAAEAALEQWSRGATPPARGAKSPAPPPAQAGPAARYVFRPSRQPGVWEMAFGGEPVAVPEKPGFACLRALIENLRREVPIADLYSRVHQAGQAGAPAQPADGQAPLDAGGRRVIENELAGLRAKLQWQQAPSVAGVFKDPQVKEELQGKIAKLATILEEDVRRSALPAPEKMLESIAKDVADALQALARTQGLELLALHLRFARLGESCGYRPPQDTDWETR
jgi:hypothetical protein